MKRSREEAFGYAFGAIIAILGMVMSKENYLGKYRGMGPHLPINYPCIFRITFRYLLSIITMRSETFYYYSQPSSICNGGDINTGTFVFSDSELTM
jgi:hypothetical protein